MQLISEELQKRITSKLESRSGAARIAIAAIAIIVGAMVLLWIFDKIVMLAMSRGYVDQIAIAFNLNRHLADAIALGVFVLIVYFSSKIASFSKVNRRVGYGGIIALLIANSIVLWQGTKDQFFETSGAATKCYVLTRDGVRYGERVGIDAFTGKPCRSVTPEMLERLQEYAKGKRPERVVSDDPAFFDLKTGEPVVWYAKSKDGEIELFDLMGFHPETGEELTPISRDVVQEWKNQERTIAERPPQRINPDEFVFFDPKTGKARAWYWRRADGEFEFYDNKGFQPRTGEPLSVVTRDVVAEWSDQAAKKCYVVTRETIRFGSKPGVDPQTGRECRPFSAGLLERLHEYEKGNRPKLVTAKDPVFFDLRTGEPNLWFGKDEKGRIQLFDLVGFHPETGQELLPITPQVVSEWKRQIDDVTRKPPQRVNPDTYGFVDQVTGEPRVWYWRSPNGDWEFFDSPGFRGTGEKLMLISPDVIDEWKREAASRAKRAADAVEAERLRQVEEARRATEDAQRAAEEQRAGDLCDQDAANPTDPRRPSAVAGVEYQDLKLNAQAAADVCAIAVQKYPDEPRYKYNLARALEFLNPEKALNLYAALARQKYVAAFDNYAGVIWREDKDLPTAIQQWQIGVRLGDPSAMVSLAYLIKKNLYHVTDPAGTRLALLTKASQLGHKGAQEMLEREQEQMDRQTEQRQTEQQQQQQMLNLFGTILGGIRR